MNPQSHTQGVCTQSNPSHLPQLITKIMLVIMIIIIIIIIIIFTITILIQHVLRKCVNTLYNNLLLILDLCSY